MTPFRALALGLALLLQAACEGPGSSDPPRPAQATFSEQIFACQLLGAFTVLSPGERCAVTAATIGLDAARLHVLADYHRSALEPMSDRDLAAAQPSRSVGLCYRPEPYSLFTSQRGSCPAGFTLIPPGSRLEATEAWRRFEERAELALRLRRDNPWYLNRSLGSMACWDGTVLRLLADERDRCTPLSASVGTLYTGQAILGLDRDYEWQGVPVGSCWQGASLSYRAAIGPGRCPAGFEFIPPRPQSARGEELDFAERRRADQRRNPAVATYERIMAEFSAPRP